MNTGLIKPADASSLPSEFLASILAAIMPLVEFAMDIP
jgi:hypothetical protein